MSERWFIRIGAAPGMAARVFFGPPGLDPWRLWAAIPKDMRQMPKPWDRVYRQRVECSVTPPKAIGWRRKRSKHLGGGVRMFSDPRGAHRLERLDADYRA